MTDNTNIDISFSRELRQKIQYLILEAEEHISQTRDILGRISNLEDGVDLDKFCGGKDGRKAGGGRN